jgi:flagellar protein FlaG
MKVDSFVVNSIGIQSGGNQGERIEHQRNVSESDFGLRKISEDNDEMLDNSVKQANKSLGAYNKYIERTVHEKTHAIIYVLRDSVTNEVIREFPPRKIEDMIAKMWELAGLLVDERR